MDCLATTSVLSNHFAPFSTINTNSAVSFHRIYRSSTEEKLCLSFSRDNYTVGRNAAMKSSREVSYLKTQQQHGTWEEPDIASDSESDSEEDESLGFGSDGEETETSQSAGVNITAQAEYERIKEEVEQLLEPEERKILQQNVTPNLEKISSEKWSPLHSLALSLQIYSMDQLVENGYDIDFVNKEGLTALHKAIIGKKEAVISHLLRKGASPHVKDKDGATPLHYAVQVGAKQTVKLLIKYDVDVNVADNEGWTPLHVAIQSRNRDIAKILLVNGADRMMKNKDGKTALDLSLCYGKDFMSYDLARLLKVVPVY
ncbi:ankyrin repeat domain-containing protein EMB506, chloroplastic [Vicia villosa]|uniref:ankyrin repeat domain-containing protein EMB506, chloroplastic n=1 Tax=Vicia villosa TaxID=3911 RepID=UPI00273C12C5|nr:ankyrin repeat domain-containing protein EMB506, chloroplastic [Vicia villosa]